MLAIDLPSGLDANTGKAEGDAVRADLTITMGLPKIGMVEPAALDYVGAIEVVEIGIPDEYVEDLEGASEREMIYHNDLKSLIKRRARSSHKGDFGHALLVGGARGYSGAIAMASRAAIRSGWARCRCSRRRVLRLLWLALALRLWSIFLRRQRSVRYRLTRGRSGGRGYLCSV